MHTQSFQISLISEKEGGYTVVVPQLPGCVSYGKTIEEAKKNAKQAIELQLASLKAHNKNNINPVMRKSVFSTMVQINPASI